MVKLLHLSRPSRRVSSAVRTWWAMRSQKRRRDRGAGAEPSPPVPVIVNGIYEWHATEYGWVDATIYWTIDYAGFPAANVEVWLQYGAVPEYLVSEAPSNDREFNQSEVSNSEDELIYRIRYRNGAVVGAFSNAYHIHVSAP